MVVTRASNLRSSVPDIVAPKKWKLIRQRHNDLRFAVGYGIARVNTPAIRMHVEERGDDLSCHLDVRIRGELKVDQIVEESVIMSPKAVIKCEHTGTQPVHVEIVLIHDTSEAPDPAAGNKPPPIILDHFRGV